MTPTATASEAEADFRLDVAAGALQRNLHCAAGAGIRGVESSLSRIARLGYESERWIRSIGSFEECGRHTVDPGSARLCVHLDESMIPTYYGENRGPGGAVQSSGAVFPESREFV